MNESTTLLATLVGGLCTGGAALAAALSGRRRPIAPNIEEIAGSLDQNLKDHVEQMDTHCTTLIKKGHFQGDRIENALREHHINYDVSQQRMSTALADYHYNQRDTMLTLFGRERNQIDAIQRSMHNDIRALSTEIRGLLHKKGLDLDNTLLSEFHLIKQNFEKQGREIEELKQLMAPNARGNRIRDALDMARDGRDPADIMRYLNVSKEELSELFAGLLNTAA